MLQQPAPRDYVIGTGRTHSVRELVQIAFECVGLDWTRYVVTDPAFIRPAEVDLLIADARLAHRELGWLPETGFETLVRMMVDADLARLAGRR